MLDSLDVRQMKLLLALLEERNLTRVASKLCVSQQAVSEQLKRLRLTFNDKLFVRAKNGVVPTPFATELGAVLGDIVSRLEDVSETKVFDPKNSHKRFVIAATEYAQLVLLVDLAQKLKERSPNIQLIITPLEEVSLEKALSLGQIDLAICEDKQAPVHLPKSKLLSDSYVCVSQQSSGIKRGNDHNHLVITQTQTRLDKLVSQWLSSQKINNYTTLTVPSYAVTPQFIRAYDAVALMPSRLLGGQQLEVIPSDQQLPSFDLIVAWHNRATQDPLHNWVKQCLNEICREKDPISFSQSA